MTTERIDELAVMDEVIRTDEAMAANKSRTADIRQARAVVEELIARQQEWLCDACNTVFPCPSGNGPLGMMCKCGNGLLKPTSLTERILRDNLAEARAAVAELIEAQKGVLASLAASVSLLERGGKKAAPSDRMFEQMLADYRKSIDSGRAAIARVGGA